MSTSFPLGDTIREANSEAVKRMLEAEPVLVDVVTASEAIPDLEEGMIPVSYTHLTLPTICSV